MADASSGAPVTIVGDRARRTSVDGPAAVSDIVARLASVIGPYDAPVPLHEPEFGGSEWSYVKGCLDAGQVSSIGGFVIRFEEALAAYTGARHAIATVNGTAALHVALAVAGVGPGDEVLMPALSFVAAANAARYCGATPHFVDSDERTLGIDASKLGSYLSRIAERRAGACVNRQTGRRIAALVAMHAFGHPVDLDPLVELCERFSLPLVEDAAQALGSTYRARHAGTIGQAGILSFNGNKVVTTGGGGAILTNDPAVAAEAKHLTTTGKIPHRWAISHDRVAYNYRLPNINAALGCAQLEQLPEVLARKRRLAERYQAAFADLPGVDVFHEPEFARSNYWLNVLVLQTDGLERRDAVLAGTHDAGILTRPAWTPMHRLAMFADCPRMDLTRTEQLFRRLIALPSSPRLARDVADAPQGTGS